MGIAQLLAKVADRRVVPGPVAGRGIVQEGGDGRAGRLVDRLGRIIAAGMAQVAQPMLHPADAVMRRQVAQVDLVDLAGFQRQHCLGGVGRDRMAHPAVAVGDGLVQRARDLQPVAKPGARALQHIQQPDLQPLRHAAAAEPVALVAGLLRLGGVDVGHMQDVAGRKHVAALPRLAQDRVLGVVPDRLRQETVLERDRGHAIAVPDVVLLRHRSCTPIRSGQRRRPRPTAALARSAPRHRKGRLAPMGSKRPGKGQGRRGHPRGNSTTTRFCTRR